MEPKTTDAEPNLAPLPAVHCVAFDFYGTMFISGVGDIGVDEGQTAESRGLFREALEDTGFEAVEQAAAEGLHIFDDSIRRYQKEHRDKGIDYPEPDIVLIWYEVLQKLVKRNLIEGELDREVAERFAVEYEFRFNPVWPMPDLVTVLEELDNQRYVLGIISNSQFYTPLAFEALTSSGLTASGFDEDLLNWSYRASVKKPSIHFYERFTTALNQKHNLKPEQVLFVGNDMLKDIKPASELGMRTALFAGDSRSYKPRRGSPKCRGVTPDIVITRLNQLAECLAES
ncbi:MAG: HAD family hydrolase [Balneolaceae bacterium]|nr:HAD family hydrolase [Balneolaceae bacterium]